MRKPPAARARGFLVSCGAFVRAVWCPTGAVALVACMADEESHCRSALWCQRQRPAEIGFEAAEADCRLCHDDGRDCIDLLADIGIEGRPDVFEAASVADGHRNDVDNLALEFRVWLVEPHRQSQNLP